MIQSGMLLQLHDSTGRVVAHDLASGAVLASRVRQNPTQVAAVDRHKCTECLKISVWDKRLNVPHMLLCGSDTLVWTIKGWVQADHVSVNDQMAIYDRVSRSYYYERVDQVSVSSAPMDMIEIQPANKSSMDIIVNSFIVGLPWQTG